MIILTQDYKTVSLQSAIAFLHKSGKKIPAKVRYIYEPHYGVNFATTKRWTSAYHGIPSNSDVKGALFPHYEGGFFLHADFAQNEYKVFSALAQEPAIVNAFREGRDIHRFIAAKVFSKPESEITKIERNVAKRLSFGLLYSKSVAAIATDYFYGDITYAQKLFDDFFILYPNIKSYINQQKEFMFNNGYVTTVFGDPIHITYDSNKLKYDVKDFIAQFERITDKESYPSINKLYVAYKSGKISAENLIFQFPNVNKLFNSQSQTTSSR